MESNNNQWQYCHQLILQKIFAKLEPIDRVNAATICEWYENTAKCRSLWKEVDLRGTNLPESILDRLPSFPIGKLNLSGCNLIMESITFPPNSEVAEPDSSLMGTLVFQRMWGFDEMKAGILLGKCRPVELFLDYGPVTIPMLKAAGKNSRLKVLSLIESVFHFPTAAELFTSSQEEILDQIAGIPVPKSVEILLLNHTTTFHPRSFADDLTVAFFVHILRNTTNLTNLGMSVQSLTPGIMEIVGNLKLLEALWFCTCEWEKLKFRLPRILRKLPRIKFVYIFKDNIACDRVVEEFFKSNRIEFPDIKTELARDGIEMTVQYTTEDGYKLLLCRN